MKPKVDPLTSGIIFVLTCLVFLLSPVRQVTDSNYSMLLSQSLLQHGSFTLDHYQIPGVNSRLPTEPPDMTPYHLHRVGGHVYYYFPPGSSVLSVPYLALTNLFGLSPVDAQGVFINRGERRVQQGLAALLMGALASVAFCTSRLLLPFGWSVMIALGSSFGTQLWSTLSRGMWSQTWGTLLLGLVVLILVKAKVRGLPLRPGLLATLLAWAYFVRPTYSVHIAAVTIFVLFNYRPLFARYALVGGAWFLGFVLYSWYHFGQLLADYYQADRLTFSAFPRALAGNLVSPGRGLITYVPVTLFVAYLLARYRGQLEHRSLAVLALIAVAGHLAVISGFPEWWGGHCYGARYTSDLIPWLVLLSILAIKAALRRRGEGGFSELSTGHKLEWALGGVLLACSILINGNGAVNPQTWRWNTEPVLLHEGRVWDWGDPQFLVR